MGNKFLFALFEAVTPDLIKQNAAAKMHAIDHPVLCG